TATRVDREYEIACEGDGTLTAEPGSTAQSARGDFRCERRISVRQRLVYLHLISTRAVGFRVERCGHCRGRCEESRGDDGSGRYTRCDIPDHDCTLRLTRPNRAGKSLNGALHTMITQFSRSLTRPPPARLSSAAPRALA